MSQSSTITSPAEFQRLADVALGERADKKLKADLSFRDSFISTSTCAACNGDGRPRNAAGDPKPLFHNCPTCLGRGWIVNPDNPRGTALPVEHYGEPCTLLYLSTRWTWVILPVSKVEEGKLWMASTPRLDAQGNLTPLPAYMFLLPDGANRNTSGLTFRFPEVNMRKHHIEEGRDNFAYETRELQPPKSISLV